MIIPKVDASSNLGLKLANAFGVICLKFNHYFPELISLTLKPGWR